MFILSITLPLAPILRTRPIELPLTRPLGLLPVQTDEAMFRYWDDLREIHHEALVRSRLTGPIVRKRDERDDLLDQLLAPPIDSTTGVPLSIPSAFVARRSRYRRDQRNLSKPMRMLDAVIRHDIERASLQTVSQLLGRTDHLLRWTATDGTQHEGEGDCRGALGDNAAARRALHYLGAWPYAHATNGRLPAAWWQRAEFTGPLGAWHAAAARGLELYLAESRRRVPAQ